MLQQTFATLEREFADENDSCIDAAKGFVECACRLLIKELEDPANPIAGWPNSPISSVNPSLTNWISAAFRLLNVVERRDDPFSKVISQHYKLTEALGKFRDLAGPVSHGKDGMSKRLSAHHRRSALLAADALVTFLHEAYLEREPDPVLSLEPYERFVASNSLIDEMVTIRADWDEDGVLSAAIILPNGEEMMLAIEPSRLLFGVDRDAYKYALDAARDGKAALTAEGETP
jgi:hypothetical protein